MRPIARQMTDVTQTPETLAVQIAGLEAQNPAAVELPESYHQLGALHYQAANYGEALSAYGQALAWQEQHLTADHPHRIASLQGLGLAHHALGDYTQAERQYQQSVRLVERHQDTQLGSAVAGHYFLVNLYCLLGRYQQAHDLEQRALPLIYTLLGTLIGADQPAILERQGHAGRPSQLLTPAEAYWHRKAQPIFSAPVPGELDPWDKDLLILGRLYRFSNSSMAVNLYEACLALYDASKGDSPLKTATPLSAIGEIYASRNQDAGCGPSTTWFTAAEPLVIRALEIREKYLAANHPLIAVSLTQVANVISGLGRYREALTLLERAVVIKEQCLGDSHLETATSRFNLAVAYQTLGYRDAAVRLLEPVLDIQLQILEPDHPCICRTRHLLALVTGQSPLI